MSEREATNLIFLPGFSTADKVTNVSGRGVGMDVVKTNIDKIGGTVDVQSKGAKLAPHGAAPGTVQTARRIRTPSDFPVLLGTSITNLNSTLSPPVRRANFRATFPPPTLAPVMLLGREREEECPSLTISPAF